MNSKPTPIRVPFTLYYIYKGRRFDGLPVGSELSQDRFTIVDAGITADVGGRAVGKVTPNSNLRRRLRAIRRAAGVTGWTQDVMAPLSCNPIGFAEQGDVNRLTLQIGHENPDMLWKALPQGEQEKGCPALYWAIMPGPIVAGDGKIVAFFRG